MQLLSALSGIIMIAAYVPYIWAILRGMTKPAKASWIIWAALDTIILAAMYAKGTVNYQIAGTILGVWTVAALSLWRGKPGWTMLDKACLGGAALAIAMWQAFDSPTLALAASLTANLIGSLPTFENAWHKPFNEDKTAWMLSWISCVFAVGATSTWSFDAAAQPLTFLLLQSVMIFILFIKPRLDTAT